MYGSTITSIIQILHMLQAQRYNGNMCNDFIKHKGLQNECSIPGYFKALVEGGHSLGLLHFISVQFNPVNVRHLKFSRQSSF